MNTDQLISRLQGDLKPVKTQMRPLAFTLFISVGLLAWVALNIWRTDPREDIGERILQYDYIFRLLLSVAWLGAAAYLAALLSNPGRPGARGATYVLVGVSIAVFLFEFVPFLKTSGEDFGEGVASWGFDCSKLALLVAGASIVAVAVIIRRRLVLAPRKTGLVLAGLAAAAGKFAIDLHCVLDNPVHVAVWHLALPSLILLLAGATLIRRTIQI